MAAGVLPAGGVAAPLFVDPGVVGLLDLCNAAISIAFLWVGLHHRDRPGATGFVVLVAGITVWSLSIGVDKFFWGLAPSVAAFNLVYLGGQITSVGWFLLTIEFTGLGRVTERLVAGLAVAVVAGQVLFWTNPLHGLVLGPGTTVENTSLATVYGPAFYPAIGAFYLLILIGTGLLLREAVRSSGVRRTQNVVLALAAVPPIVASVVTVFDLAFAPYDVTPFGFLFAEVFFAWVLFRLQLFGVVSAGRRAAVEELPDAVLTLDVDDCIVDANAAATALFGVDGGDVGRPIVDALKWHPELARRLEADDVDGSEVTVERDGERRHVQLVTSEFEARAGDGTGRILVVRDVTERKRRERQLQARQRELDRLRRVLTGMLQEDLRSSLSVLERDARSLRDRFDDGRAAMAEAVMDQVADLQDLSGKVMAISWLSERRETADQDIAALAEEIAAEYRERFPAATIEVDVHDRPTVHASDGLDLAVENVIENAVVHGGDAVTVRVTVESTDGMPRVRIADDGPGIPEAEVEVLERETETKLSHGTGIGLWLVKLVVDHSNATLSIEADETGTTVTIEFPPAGQRPGWQPEPVPIEPSTDEPATAGEESTDVTARGSRDGTGALD